MKKNTKSGSSSREELSFDQVVNLMSGDVVHARALDARFRSVRKRLAWFTTRGKVLLVKEKPLSLREWVVLHDRAADLKEELGGNKLVGSLFAMVMAKGIFALKHYAALQPQHDLRKPHTRFRDWYDLITSQFKPDGLMGSHSKVCSLDDARRMIDSLVQIVKYAKDGTALKNLAGLRFPGDSQAQAMFEKAHRNWP